MALLAMRMAARVNNVNSSAGIPPSTPPRFRGSCQTSFGSHPPYFVVIFPRINGVGRATTLKTRVVVVYSLLLYSASFVFRFSC